MLRPEDVLTIALGAIKSAISDLGDVTDWLGVTTTPLTDGATTNPIIIDGASVTATAGDFVQYGSSIFVFSKDGVWQEASLKITFTDDGGIIIQ